MIKASVNVRLMENLLQWDPLGYGVDAYDTECVDVVQAVHELDDINKLAKKIQDIYEFSFEEFIPLSKCKEKAVELMVIKNSEDSCTL
jgi:RNA processing factor Prp31